MVAEYQITIFPSRWTCAWNKYNNFNAIHKYVFIVLKKLQNQRISLRGSLHITYNRLYLYSCGCFSITKYVYICLNYIFLQKFDINDGCVLHHIFIFSFLLTTRYYFILYVLMCFIFWINLNCNFYSSVIHKNKTKLLKNLGVRRIMTEILVNKNVEKWELKLSVFLF